MLYDGLVARRVLATRGDEIRLTGDGENFFADFGIDLAPLVKARRPLCRSCLDWSSRRNHLAGALGTAILDRIQHLGWAKRREGTRVVAFTRTGERAFVEAFRHPAA